MTGSIPAADPSPLRLVSWNILAAPWAGPQWYPSDMDRAVLDRATRRAAIGRALQSLAPDLCCLQEATPSDLEAIRCVLGEHWSVHFASNGNSLWANWGSPEIPWEPNGTAIAWDTRRSTCVERGAIDLGTHGNAATWAHLLDTVTQRALIVVSLHLDSDDRERRRAELAPLFATLDEVAPDTIAPDTIAPDTIAPDTIAPDTIAPDTIAVLIAGDYNEDTIDPDHDRGTDGFGTEFFNRGFDDVLARLGRRDPTHAYARPGDDWVRLATIDHVMVRRLVPVAGQVVDVGLWEIESAAARMEECLRRTGSDHLALCVELDFESAPFAADHDNVM